MLPGYLKRTISCELKNWREEFHLIGRKSPSAMKPVADLELPSGQNFVAPYLEIYLPR